MNDLQDLSLEELMNELEQMESNLAEKDLFLSSALEQAEKWKRQAQDQVQQVQRLQSQISEISSVNLMLKRELQKKSEIIVQLNGKEEIYNKSDLIKKENEALKQSEKLAWEKAEAEIRNVKREYTYKEQESERIKSKAEALISQAETTIKSQNELIMQKAEEMYQRKKTSLKTAYKSKEMALEGSFFVTIIYGVLITLFTAVRSKVFVSDFKSFVMAIWNVLQVLFGFTLKVSKQVAQLGDMIQQPILATIVHWVLLIVVMVLMCGGLGVLIIGGSISAFNGYTKKLEFADVWSLFMFLVILGLSVFFADEIRAFVPINLLLLNVMMHAIYVFMRWYNQEYGGRRFYY